MRRVLLLIFLLLAAAALTVLPGCGGALGAGADDGGDDAIGGDDAPPAPDGGGWHGDGLPPDPLAARPGVVVYWGQNGWGGAHPAEPDGWEPSLAEVCAAPSYDVVVLGFVTSFVSARNGGLPETNFSYHCEQPIDVDHPFLLRCPEMEAGIAACHAAGKKVLISLGGAAGAYGFTDDAQAEAFATTVWDTFLGGDGARRPFGDQVLDGVDLDVEGGGPAGYAAFARALRGRMDAAGDGWLLTAAPQCPYPDGHLGPAPGTALGDAADAFDYVFVQFYNNWCRASSGAPFDDSYAAWRALAGAGGPRVVVGLPATPDAAPAGGYVAPEALAPLLDGVAGDPAFAGVMLWDASFDRHSGAPTYAARAAALLGD
ncbi:MAG: hypothetical protein H6709_24610 [Kofleriaceae bacterium]|nr:hypothetical protein [Kofleriaceae bacterium]